MTPAPEAQGAGDLAARTAGAARELRGRPAAPGLARGPVFHLAAAATRRRAGGDPAAERAALDRAIAAAVASLAALAADSGADAAEMLEFQIAMLEDEALSAPAQAAIAGGTPADAAWRAALDAEIEGYGASGDEYFRARAADLADLRDRVLGAMAPGLPAESPPPSGAIVAAEDLSPSRFLAIDWSAGGAIILAGGSATSHVAMLARARGVPMVVGVGGALLAETAREALVDGEAGSIVLDPGPAEDDRFARSHAAAARHAAAAAAYLDRPAATADGTPVTVMINVGDIGGLDRLDPAQCDGIGLVRSEFLFQGAALPDEAAQTAAYARILAWAGGRPVTIRTLDAGGDKPIPGVTLAGESNPFLGLRGIRLSLARPEIFRIQLRALARAAATGPLKVMLPMVTTPEELEAARTLLDAECAALAAAGVPAARPALGIMVEVPAAALAIDRFDAAFLSVGSNDLVQYLCAAARDGGAVADLADPLHPAVLRILRALAEHGARAGIEVSLCGDAGGEPAVIPHLLGCGLRSLSVAPTALARTKAAIAAVDLSAPPPGPA